MASYLDVVSESGVLDDASKCKTTTRAAEFAVVLDTSRCKTIGKTSESAVLNDAARSTASWRTSESAVLNDRAVNTLAGTTKAVEVAVLNDASFPRVANLGSEVAVLDDAARCTLRTLTAEAAVLNDLTPGWGSVKNRASEVAVLGDRGVGRLSDVAAETGILDDNSGFPARVGNLGTESAVLNDALVDGGRRSNLAHEGALLHSASLPKNRAINIAMDYGYLSDRVVWPRTGLAWAATTDLFNMSRYTNFPFHALAAVDDKLVGFTDDGAYLFDANDDAGAKIVAATVGDINDNIDGQQGQTSVPNFKRPAYLYLSYQSPGTVRLVMWETSNGTEERHEFELPPQSSEKMVGGRVQLDEGIESRFFRFGFENVAGAPFGLNEGRVMFNVLQRRA